MDENEISRIIVASASEAKVGHAVHRVVNGL